MILNEGGCSDAVGRPAAATPASDVLPMHAQTATPLDDYAASSDDSDIEVTSGRMDVDEQSLVPPPKPALPAAPSDNCAIAQPQSDYRSMHPCRWDVNQASQFMREVEGVSLDVADKNDREMKFAGDALLAMEEHERFTGWRTHLGAEMHECYKLSGRLRTLLMAAEDSAMSNSSTPHASGAN